MSVTVFNAPAENKQAKLNSLISAISTFGNIYAQGKELGLKKNELDALKQYHDQSIEAEALKSGFVKAPPGYTPSKDDQTATLGDKTFIYKETPGTAQQRVTNLAQAYQGVSKAAPFTQHLQNWFGQGPLAQFGGQVQNQVQSAFGLPQTPMQQGSPLTPMNTALGGLGGMSPMNLSSSLMQLMGPSKSPQYQTTGSNFKVLAVH